MHLQLSLQDLLHRATGLDQMATDGELIAMAVDDADKQAQRESTEPPPAAEEVDAGAGGSESTSGPSPEPAAKTKGKAAPAPAKRSARQQGKPAPAPVQEPSPPRQNATSASGGASSTDGANKNVETLLEAADRVEGAGSGAASSKEGDGSATKVDPPPPRPDPREARPGHKNRENTEHASGVWKKYSPTGIDLGEEYCESFDHSDGKAWYRKVYNSVTDYPEEPHPVAYYPSNKDKPRFVEVYPRSIVHAVRIAPLRSHVTNTDPNERLYPTEHKADKTRFEGTLLSALDLVWCTEDALNINYKNWCAAVRNEMEEGVYTRHEEGVHQYISDIVGGYYVKLDTSAAKKYAILYPYRPMRSPHGEPEIMVLELDQDEKFVDNATPKSVKADRIIEIGGGCNSLCEHVVAWLKDNMGVFYNGIRVESGTSNGQVDPGRASEKMLGILNMKELKESFQMCIRKRATALLRDDDLMGVRRGRIQWHRIVEKATNKKAAQVEKAETAVWPEVTAYDKWLNTQLLKSVEIAETLFEFSEHGGDDQISLTRNAIWLEEMLTQQEEDILKYLDEAEWHKPKVAQALTFFDDPYHKLDDEGKVSPSPVVAPFMFSAMLLDMVTITTAQTPDARSTELTSWTSRYSRELVRRAMNVLERKEHPQWLLDETAKRDKAKTQEEKNQRKAANRPGGNKAPGEPSDDDDDEGLEGATPSPKPQRDVFDPLNRKPRQDPPRGHVDNKSEKFGGCEDKDRKVGVIACFLNETGKRKNKHWWCVCDRAPKGHWVNTQGNHSDDSLSHPNALMDGYSLSSKTKKYHKASAGASQPRFGQRRSGASSSSGPTSEAEVNLIAAQGHIDNLTEQIEQLAATRDELHLQLHKSIALANEKLIEAAAEANGVTRDHAREIRTKDENVNAAIAKMNAMRGHAHQFAELMLAKYVEGEAPDKITAWNAFSGLLTDEKISEAFGDGKPKAISSSSQSMYDVSGFNSITSSIASPALKQPYHLTAAKVKQSSWAGLGEYEALPPVTIAPYNNMKAPATSKKRAHGEIGGDEDLDDEDEEEDDDNTLVV